MTGEPSLHTYQVYAQLDNFCSAALLSWFQGYRQHWPSLPSPLGLPPPCPWPRIPFEPSGAISPYPSDAAAVLVFNSLQPCLAQPWVSSIQAHPWANIPARPHPQGGDWWSRLLAEPGYSLWVCPTPSLGYRGAGPLQSGWDGIQICNKHLTFCSWYRLSTDMQCISWCLSSVLIICFYQNAHWPRKA